MVLGRTAPPARGILETCLQALGCHQSCGTEQHVGGGAGMKSCFVGTPSHCRLSSVTLCVHGGGETTAFNHVNPETDSILHISIKHFFFLPSFLLLCFLPPSLSPSFLFFFPSPVTCGSSRTRNRTHATAVSKITAVKMPDL